MKISPKEALDKLSGRTETFATLFRHGSLEVEIFKPEGTDTQQPHEKDEIYFIISGNGAFFHEENIKEVASGDLLFVPAGDEHRFERFSEDFVVWVIFYGPKGGESQ